MYITAPYRLAIIISAALLNSSCAYFDRIRQDANYLQIENSISISRLEEAKKFTSRAPLDKAYEFTFTNAQHKSFSLLFTVHESRFSESTLMYRKTNDLHRQANQIDENMGILIALTKNLPQYDEVAWETIGHGPNAEAQDSYQVMLEYIRFKIRDS